MMKKSYYIVLFLGINVSIFLFQASNNLLDGNNGSKKKISHFWKEWVRDPFMLSGCLSTIAFRAFIQKSYAQMADKTLSFSELRKIVPFSEGLTQGIKNSPTIFSLLFVQMGIEKKVSQSMKELDLNKFTKDFSSCSTTAFLSVPANALLNALTMKKPLREALYGINKKVASAIFVRELLFFGALKANEPLSKEFEKITVYPILNPILAAMSIGFLGGIVSNPADRALTLIQSGKPLPNNFIVYFYGAFYRSKALGLALTPYSLWKDYGRWQQKKEESL